MIRLIRRLIARRALQRIVDANRNSFACEDYRRRRAAAIKGRAERNLKIVAMMEAQR
jgi:hypothetical protein